MQTTIRVIVLVVIVGILTLAFAVGEATVDRMSGILIMFAILGTGIALIDLIVNINKNKDCD